VRPSGICGGAGAAALLVPSGAKEPSRGFMGHSSAFTTAHQCVFCGEVVSPHTPADELAFGVGSRGEGAARLSTSARSAGLGGSAGAPVWIIP